MSDTTTIRVFRVDAAEFAKFCRLAGITSPEMFHTLIARNLDGDIIAKIEKEELSASKQKEEAK